MCHDFWNQINECIILKQLTSLQTIHVAMYLFF